MATILPSPSAWTTSATAMDRWGPQSAHAVGWAWKRRERGSSYSAWQAVHRGKSDIVVKGRSYGGPVTIV
jgi:hypothetical protein